MSKATRIMKHELSFFARNVQECSFLGLLLTVAFVNLYSKFTSELANPIENNWVIACYAAILYIAPINRWKSVIFTLVVSHVCWQLLLYNYATNWPMMLLELSASVYISFCAKRFNNSWRPSDFTGDMMNYLPGLVPCYFFYGTFLVFRQLLINYQTSTRFIFDLNFVLVHFHLLEFAVAASITFSILYCHRKKFTLPTNNYVTVITVVAHLGFVYMWPHNLIPLFLVMIASTYYFGLGAITIPSLVSSLALPFIVYDGGTLLDQINQFNYGFLILLSAFIGIIHINITEAAKKGEPYRLTFSQNNLTGFSIAPLEIDDLRFQLNEKNQEISQAYIQLEQTYADLEHKNNHLNTLTVSLETQKQSYKSLAEIDQLTGLKSRHYFYNFLADDARIHLYSLILIDLDNFKSVNDLYGHNSGDQLLKACAAVFSNIVNYDGFVARLGGEEFCIAVENKDIHEAQKLADLLRYRLSTSGITRSGAHICRTASIGVAELAIDAQLNDAVSLADEALYQSKAKGKNRTTLADTSFILQLENNKQSPKLADILLGLANEEFQLYIQPICDNNTRKAVGFESLMRWHRADGSVLSPDHFLDIALSPPAYPEFKKAALAQLIPILAGLMSRNPDYYLSFNTDNTFINSTEFVTNLISQLKGSKVNLNRLVLELPEKTALDNMQQVLSNIALLQNNGIGIALDDFGMEYSNMDRIRDVPADIVKIDRSFIANMEENPRSIAVIKSLVHMAKELNFQIIAEGIETEAQQIILAESGVTRAQGYYYGHPKPVAYWLEKIDSGLI